MAFDRFYITDIGRSYLAKAQTGQKLVITKAVIGKGALPDESMIPSITAVIDPVITLNIAGIKTNGAQTTVSMQFTNRTADGSLLPGFSWYEVALFAQVENNADCPEAIYAYANAIDATHADYIGNGLTEFKYNMILNTGNATNITAMIDESLIFASMQDLQEVADGKVADTSSDETGQHINVNDPDLILSDGNQIMMKPDKDIPDGAGISVNGGTEYPIYTTDDKPIEGGIPAGSYVQLVFDDVKKRWYVVASSSGGIGKVTWDSVDCNGQTLKTVVATVQAKIDAVSTDLQSHVENTEVHLQPGEREKWNAASEGGKKPIVISDTQPEDTAQEINGLWLRPVTSGDETEKDYKVYVKTAAKTYTESNLETAASMVIYSDNKTAEEKYTELSEAISSAEEEITALQESQSTQGTDLTEVKSRAVIAASATGSGAEITLELPDTPKAGSLITFKAPAAAAEGVQIKVGETAYPVLDLSGEPVKAEAWAANSMVTLALGDTNAFLQGGKGGSTALIKSVILRTQSWALDETTQLYKQTITIPELEADHKVDFDISPLLLASLEADITPVNQNGTLYAYTSEAPASDLSVQATLTKVEVVS